jgi:hypothetical protein
MPWLSFSCWALQAGGKVLALHEKSLRFRQRKLIVSQSTHTPSFKSCMVQRLQLLRVQLLPVKLPHAEQPIILPEPGLSHLDWTCQRSIMRIILRISSQPRSRDFLAVTRCASYAHHSVVHHTTITRSTPLRWLLSQSSFAHQIVHQEQHDTCKTYGV